MRWRYAAFELDPSVPAEGVDARAYLAAKYDAAAVEAIHERLVAVAAAEGLRLDPSVSRVRPNTFPAHRLLTAALGQGAEAQQALADELFRAYWAEGRNVGDVAVLDELAAAAGLDGELARRALVDEALASAVRDEERAARESGIRAVPTFIVGGRFAVTGAQEPEVLAAAVRRALSPPGE